MGPLPTKPVQKRPRKSAAAAAPALPATEAPAPTGPAAGPCVAGIGASAGGYDAIRNLFRAMPNDSGIGFVIVQHLDPSHTSLAAELFGQCTSMPVEEIADVVAVVVTMKLQAQQLATK